MIRILIVDDEKMIRDGIVKTMPWEEMGMEVAGSAADGEKALELIAELKPHIVLTDIRMPKMDGLELLRRGRLVSPQTRFVILSGYEEFAYAQQAVKYGAIDYLLKPLSEDELKRILLKVKEDLEGEISGYYRHLVAKKRLAGDLELLCAAVRAGAGRDALSRIDAILGDGALSDLELGQFRDFCIETMYSALDASEKAHKDMEERILLDGAELERMLTGITSVSGLKQWLRRFIESLTERVNEYAAGNYQPMMKKAVEYIEAHFMEDISIKDVASSILLSPNYFSHVFKKARGESFTDFLNRLRIEEAKEILLDGKSKVYEVAEMVGYRDYKYFSSVFKKYAGVSPGRFAGDSE